MKSFCICLLPGDGIGPDVIEQARKVLEKLPVSFEFIYGDIGYGAFKRLGNNLPDETLTKVEKADATLMGAVTTPFESIPYTSPVIKLRKKLDLFANIRPVKIRDHRFVIIRENTEGLYSGIERMEEKGRKAITERIITKKGCERILHFAFTWAIDHAFKKITIVHKANILRKTCGLFRDTALRLHSLYKTITLEEMLVDACAMKLISHNEEFGVIVTTNMFGDILSDEAAALMGGLGVAPSANIGLKNAVFEPVHGSAPQLEKTNTANPIAAINTAGLMLTYLGLHKERILLDAAVRKTIDQGNITPDLGGRCTTVETTHAIIENLKENIVAPGRI